MAIKAKPDQVKKDALPKPPGAEPHDKPVGMRGKILHPTQTR
jgi:hypothetical protein